MRKNGFTLLGIEGTRGTLASTLHTVPNTAGKFTAGPKYAEDKSLIGQSGDIRDVVLGVRADTYEGKCYLFTDAMAVLFRGLLGSTDATTAAISSTTFATGGGALGATTFASTASIPAGSVVILGTAGTTGSETKLVTGVTGGGPYTVTVGSPLAYAHLAADPITGLTAHQFSLLNSYSVGSQPPSLSVQDFDGANAYQGLGYQLDSLDIEYGVDKEMMATFKLMGNPFTSIATPSFTIPSEHLIPGWSQCDTIAGTALNTVEDGTLNLKRNTKPIFAGGSQGPQSVFADVLAAAGKEKFTVYSGDSTLTNGLARTPLVVVREFTDPVTGHLIRIQMSQVQYTNPARLAPGNEWTEVEAGFTAEMNATDAISTGISQMLVTVGNAQSTAY